MRHSGFNAARKVEPFSFAFLWCSAFCKFGTYTSDQLAYNKLSQKKTFFPYFQVENIKEKYSMLEKEYVASRVDTKEKMTEFIVTNAGVQLSKFNDHLKNIRECVSKKQPLSMNN